MEKTFLTPAFGLVTIPVSFMAPQETPRGIVQIVHGMCEHKERYFPLMEFLAANGYAAVCHDHIGHGSSAPAGADPARTWGILEPDRGADQLVEDCQVVYNALSDLVSIQDRNQAEPAEIPNNVNDLLNELIERSVHLVGKPVELMTKEDKVRAIQFLSNSGALLITKSGDKIANYFGISKYTLYSYLDTKLGGETT